MPLMNHITKVYRAITGDVIYSNSKDIVYMHQIIPLSLNHPLTPLLYLMIYMPIRDTISRGIMMEL